METTEAIKRWRSIRRFKDTPVPREVIRAVLEAARRAPSWENLQPWRFIVVRDPQTKEHMFRVAFKQRPLVRAPVVIACAGDTSVWRPESQRKALWELRDAGATEVSDEIIEKLFLSNPAFAPQLGGQGVILARTFEALGYAIAFMLLEAVNRGLGACVVGAFGNEVTRERLEDYMALKERLGLPQEWLLLTMVCLGYPDEAPGPRPRKPLSEIAFLERYPAPIE